MPSLIIVLTFLPLLVIASEITLPPEIPNFSLTDLERLESESKAAKTKWDDYQQAMKLAFDLTESFVTGDRNSDLKIKAAQRFLELWGEVDNPFSDEDNEQILIIQNFLESRVNPGLPARAPEPPSDLQSAYSNELSMNLEPECALVFEHCLQLSFISLPALNLGDQYVRLDPSLVSRDGYLFEVKTRGSEKRFSGELKTFLPNDQLSGRVSIKNGLKHGPFTRWYSNGAIAIEGSYKKGELSGSYKELYRNGELRRVTTMKKGVPSKKESIWYESGSKKAEIGLSSSSSVLNGRTKAWFKNGNLAFDGRFSVGDVFREHIFFHSNGEIAARYKVVKKGKCYQERMQDRIGTLCPPENTPLIKKIGSYWDAEGALRWSSTRSKLTEWDRFGAETGITKNRTILPYDR